MKRLFTVSGILLVALAAGIILSKRRAAETNLTAQSGKSPAPVPVLLTNAATMTLPEELHTFGTVEPVLTVSVKSQVTGILSEVRFTEGQDVHEGDLLFTIDSRPFEATLKQAEATLARDLVQSENASRESDRQKVLLEKGISAQDVYDTATTTAATLKATVQADQAAVDFAKLQVEYCTIRSPITGRTGKTLIHRGNLVKADDTALVTINQTQPIDVRFTLPQQELGRIRNGLKTGIVKVIVTPSTQEANPETGILSFLDNAVDQSTGTIELKARFENMTGSLWPGQFANVVISLAHAEKVLTVPETAVLPGQQGSYVYVKGMDGKVSARPVTVDRTIAGVSVISHGLKEGDVVVTDGQLRLKPGASVTSKSETTAKPSTGHP